MSKKITSARVAFNVATVFLVFAAGASPVAAADDGPWLRGRYNANIGGADMGVWTISSDCAQCDANVSFYPGRPPVVYHWNGTAWVYMGPQPCCLSSETLTPTNVVDGIAQELSYQFVGCAQPAPGCTPPPGTNRNLVGTLTRIGD